MAEEITDNEETTYDKGRELENEFAAFMKAELGWTSVRVGAQMRGKMNIKGAAIDIISQRLSSDGKFFRILSIVFFIVFVLLTTSGFYDYLKISTNNGLGMGLIAGGLISIIFAGILLCLSIIFRKEHGWVECKNLSGKANINHIRKSLAEYNDYKNSGNKEHKFVKHYFVSASGFIENALKIALDSNIECWEKKDGKFTLSKYWQ